MKTLKAFTLLMAMGGLFILGACGNGKMDDSSGKDDMKQQEMKKDDMKKDSDMKKKDDMGSDDMKDDKDSMN